MNHATEQANRKAKQDAEAEKAFQQWIAKPETKMILSLIQPNEAMPEAVTTMMRSAFDAGRGVGQGEIASMMIDAILRSPPKKPSDF